MKPVSIVIKSRNNFDYLKACIYSIREHMEPGHEIIIVLNGCKEDEVQTFKIKMANYPLAAPYKIIVLEDAGLCTATNVGVEAATNEWVWLFDDDYYVARGSDIWLSKTPLIENTVYSNILIEPGLQPVSPYLVECDCGKSLETFDDDDFDNVSKIIARTTRHRINEVSYPVLLEKRLYQDVGGLDPRFDRAYANDPDFWYRLALKGAQFIRIGSSVFYHFSGRSNNAALKSRRQAIEIACNRDFIRKWGELFNYSFGSNVHPTVPVYKGNEQYLTTTLAFISNRYEALLDKIEKYEPYFDEVVIVWTGAKGKLQAAIEAYCEGQLSVEPLINKFKIIEVDFQKDFAKIRNMGCDVATSEWIVWLDDDEDFQPQLIQQLRAMLYKHNNIESLKTIGIPRINVVDGKQTPVYPDHQFRIHRKDIRWVGEVHEVPEPVFKRTPNTVMTISGLNLIHQKSSTIYNQQQALYDEIRPGAGSKRIQ